MVLFWQSMEGESLSGQDEWNCSSSWKVNNKNYTTTITITTSSSRSRSFSARRSTAKSSKSFDKSTQNVLTRKRKHSPSAWKWGQINSPINVPLRMSCIRSGRWSKKWSSCVLDMTNLDAITCWQSSIIQSWSWSYWSALLTTMVQRISKFCALVTPWT